MLKKISVIIITKDEEKNIGDCLESVKWADEIIVVDAMSKDRTVETAKKFTDKVFIRDWDGFASQKNYALSLATYEWVLSIDADERVTTELQNEILSADTSGLDGFMIRRRNFLLDKEIKTCGWGNDFQLRFFNRKKTSLTGRLVHEGFEVDGTIGKLSEPMLHYTFSSFADYFSKMNHYTTLKSQEMVNSGKHVNGFTIFSHTTAAFFVFFITRLGFKDGVYGLIVSLLHSVSTMMVYIKLWELQKKNSS